MAAGLTTRAGFLAVVAAALLAGAGAEVVRRSAWTTVDEHAHVPAARTLRFGGGPVTNFEHPVLMKLLAGAALGPQPAPRGIEETRRARRPFPFVLAALVLVTGVWVLKRAGPAWGAAAAFLLALEPTLRGHGALVENDVLVSLFLVAAAAALDAGARGGRRAPWLLAGVSAGLALASKHSAAPMLAVLLVAGLLLARGVPRRVAAARLGLLVLLPALLTAALVQELAHARVSRASLREAAVAQFRQIRTSTDAAAVVDSLPKGAAAWWLGLQWVRSRALPGKWCNVFLGRVSGKGSPLYFPVALALKLTTATVAALLLALAAAGALLVRRRARWRAALARAALPALLAAAFLGMAALSNVNIGVRHVLPAVPLALAAAAGVSSALAAPRPRLAAALLALLVAGAAAEAWALRGREISFGNVIAGGPHGLRRYLSDSNVDWGQEQGLVFAAARSGAYGKVGAVSILLDAREASASGVRWVGRLEEAEGLDTVFVSAFCDDLARGLAANEESYPRIVLTRRWVVPLVGGLGRRARGAALAGDTWVLLRMR